MINTVSVFFLESAHYATTNVLKNGTFNLPKFHQNTEKTLEVKWSKKASV